MFLVLFLAVQVMPYFYLGHPPLFYILQNNCKLSLLQLVYYVIEMYDKHNCISFGNYLIDRTPSDVSYTYKQMPYVFCSFQHLYWHAYCNAKDCDYNLTFRNLSYSYNVHCMYLNGLRMTTWWSKHVATHVYDKLVVLMVTDNCFVIP